MKTCFKCRKTKDYSDFYVHAQMSDGYLGKCKQCTKADALKHRNKNIKRIQAYDRNRPNGKIRAKRDAARRQTDARAKELNRIASREWDNRNRDKKRSHAKVQSALRSGRLVKLPCEICQTKDSIQAHHPDYSLPLEVIWLCTKHHAALHRRERALKRGSF